MKTKTLWIILGIFAFLIVLTLVIFAISPGLLATITGDRTPIFCNDYEFTCCGDYIEFTSTLRIEDERPTQCPSWASYCKVVSCEPRIEGVKCYRGSTNCRFRSNILGRWWSCDDLRQVPAGTSLKANEYLWVLHPTTPQLDTSGQVVLEVHRPRLAFCGRAACDAGVTGIPILGADECHFNPELDKIYDVSTKRASELVSYTVPMKQCTLSFQSGNRHLCGYKEETCTSDADCDGHTYGNYECYGRTLQRYGCREFGTPTDLEIDRLPGEPGWGESSSEVLFGKRCEIVEARNVQCCGDYDCGLDYFCDTGNTWTCKQEAECRNDYDCGVTIRCDWVDKKLKKPICSAGKCTFEETPVDCCSDRDCTSGYYCTADYKCEKRVIVKKPCPFECCEREELYFDRACPPNKPFCIDNACYSEDIPIGYCKNCDAFALSRLFGGIWKERACKPKLLQTTITCLFSFIKLFLVPIVFIVSLLFGAQLFGRFKAIREKKFVIWILSVVVAVIIAYLTFILFWVGVLLFIGYVVARFAIKFTIGKGK